VKKSPLFIGMNIGLHDVGVATVEIAPEIKVQLIEEERLTRIKNKGGYPYLAVQELSSQLDLDLIPQEQFSLSSLTYTTERIQERPFHTEYLEANKAGRLDPSKELLNEFSHHECHLFSMLPLIPERHALIVVADGCGSRMEKVRKLHVLPHPPLQDLHGNENVSIYLKKGEHLECLKKFTHKDLADIPGLLHNSPSYVYERTSTMIFGDNKYAGKVMGLASLRPMQPPTIDELREILQKPLTKKTVSKTEFDALSPEELQWRVDLSHAAQNCFQNYFLSLFAELKVKFPAVSTVAFVGGCALNCPLNTTVMQKKWFKHFILSPFPNDEGIAIGAALANAYKLGRYKINRHFYGKDIPFIGAPRDFSMANVERHFSKLASIEVLKDVPRLARLLARGEVLAWIEGRSEAGPRALGHRSLLASPFKKGIKKKLNDSYKFREAFRPYGVSVLRGDARTYFELPKGVESPYMSLTPVVKPSEKKRFREILQPDGSIRIQTVGPAHKSLTKLLRAFKKESGHGVLIHTSLNVMNEPIVETLVDAGKFFTQSPVKYMVINGLLLTKLPGRKNKS
jgi:carbamoyltransferase